MNLSTAAAVLAPRALSQQCGARRSSIRPPQNADMGRLPENVFEEFCARRKGLLRALTTDVRAPAAAAAAARMCRQQCASSPAACLRCHALGAWIMATVAMFAQLWWLVLPLNNCTCACDPCRTHRWTSSLRSATRSATTCACTACRTAPGQWTCQQRRCRQRYQSQRWASTLRAMACRCAAVGARVCAARASARLAKHTGSCRVRPTCTPAQLWTGLGVWRLETRSHVRPCPCPGPPTAQGLAGASSSALRLVAASARVLQGRAPHQDAAVRVSLLLLHV